MLPGVHRRDASPRRSVDVPLLNQEGFDDVFQRVAVFADRGRQILNPDGAARELFQNRREEAPVDEVEPHGVDVEKLERLRSHFLRHHAVVHDFGEVAHAAKQPVRDAGRAAAAVGDLACAFQIDRDAEKARGAPDDRHEVLGTVELKLARDPEAGAKRVRKRPRARRGSNQGEGRQVDLDRAGGGAFADHDVDLVVLQGRVEHFLDDGREPVDFVDEENVVGFEVREHGGQVAGALQNGAGSLPEVHAHLARDDVRECGFSQAGRSEEEHVVQGLSAALRRADEDVQLLPHRGLPHVFGKSRRAKRPVGVLFVGVGGGPRHQAFIVDHDDSPTLVGERAERLADPLRHFDVGGERLDGGCGFAFVVAERHERREDVGLGVGMLGKEPAHDGELALQFKKEPFRRLLPDAGYARQEPRLPLIDRGGEVVHRHPREQREAHLGADAVDADHRSEDVALTLREEAVEELRVLAHDVVREERHLVPLGREIAEGGHGNVELVADAAGVDDDLRRFLFDEGAADASDHVWGLVKDEC